MSLQESKPLATSSASGIVGSRKINLKRDSPASAKPILAVVSDALLEMEDVSEDSTPVGFDSPVTNDSKSSLVDSVFSNFMARKMEEVEIERKDKTGGKKSKHKKEKHKKHKHKDKDKEHSKKESETSGHIEPGSLGGFFAKEKFLEPGVTDAGGLSDDHSSDGDSAGHKYKKHKKHKKHKDHKTKDKESEKPEKQSNSKLLSFHEDMLPDPGLTAIPTKKQEISNGEAGAATSVKKVNPKNVYANKMEKALELKLSSLKENLTKQHKALEDLGKEVTIPEKKIKMMADFSVTEKLKGLRDSDIKSTSNIQVPVMDLSEIKLPSDDSFAALNSTKLVKEEKVQAVLGVKLDEKERSVQSTNGQVLGTKSESVARDNNGADGDGFRAMKPMAKLKEEEEEREKQVIKESKPATKTQLGKKTLGLSLGLKLSETSKTLISSGVRVENDPKKRNREEGEITDSQEDSHHTSSSSAGSENDSTGEIKDDKKHRKKKSKEKRRNSSDRKQRDKRSRSKTPKKRRRSKSYDEERGVWKSKSRRRRSRSRSRSRDRRHRSRDRDHRRRSRSRSKDRRDRHFYYNDRYRRSRSREKVKEKSRKQPSEDLRLKIDKAKLRQIAMKNAYAMLNNEETMQKLKPDQLAVIKAGGKSVEELTNFCRRISEKDPRRDSSEEEELLMPSDTEEVDTSQPFVHHPFAVKPAPMIALNIRNAKQIPTTTFADRTAKAGELRLQFPVSSGSQHKNKEDEWTPVEKTTAPPTKPVTTATTAQAPAKVLPKPSAIKPPAVVSTPAVVEQKPEPVAAPAVKPQDSVFPEAQQPMAINISDVVSERLSAMRKLQANPHDSEAMGAMYKAQKAMNDWAVVKNEPGKFTGHTELKGMSQRELQGRGAQAWIKKDMFQRAAPVRGGIGKLLLKKMGWREGAGLGKDETGDVMPLNMELKTDRKGLGVSEEPIPAAPAPYRPPPVRDLSGKHPVSALMEVCKRKQWNQPNFMQVAESGPAHKKKFVFKVHVNGVDYQPTMASPNKKNAKAQAATVALQSFGLMPKDAPV